MLRVRLGFHAGPFVMTSDRRRRATVRWTLGERLAAVLLALAAPTGVLLAWWVGR